MGLLDRFRSKASATKSAGKSNAPGKFECLHQEMVAHWDDPANEGDESKATEFVCTSCESHLTPQQAGWARKRGVEGTRR